MKALVVFYSLEGHTKLLAEAIGESIEGEVVRAKPKKDIPSKGFMKYFKGGGQVFRKVEPEIYPVSADPSQYDVFFIGCPVWAGGYSPTLRTLFSQWQLEGKKVALFVSHRGGKGSALEKMAESLKGNDIIGMKDFNEGNGSDINLAEAEKWAQGIMNSL